MKLTKQQKNDLKQAEERYGEINFYVKHIRQLLRVDDCRQSDIQETLRDVNFIYESAGINCIDEFDLLEMIA